MHGLGGPLALGIGRDAVGLRVALAEGLLSRKSVDIARRGEHGDGLVASRRIERVHGAYYVGTQYADGMGAVVLQKTRRRKVEYGVAVDGERLYYVVIYVTYVVTAPVRSEHGRLLDIAHVDANDIVALARQLYAEMGADQTRAP